MEDFISEIYEGSFIITGFKEYIYSVDSCRPKYARYIYNKTAAALEKYLSKIAVNDITTANSIQSIALQSKDSYNDPCINKGIIKAELIPELYKYLRRYTEINATEGIYTIKSTNTGFLTIHDQTSNIFYHDTYDPIEEAFNICRTIYNPNLDMILVLGCGLGYLAYELYHQSHGSLKIRIYEDDPSMVDYAYAYGVLSLIPEDLLDIVLISNTNKLATQFINDHKAFSNCDIFISPWKESLCKGASDNELSRLKVNRQFELEMSDQAIINVRKNHSLPKIKFEDIKRNYLYDEWILISAGPSLDDNVAFIKNNIGKKGLIAVNTVLSQLIKMNIIPDLVVAADQSNAMVRHIDDVSDYTGDIYLIADWALNWKYTHKYQGSICFIRTSASKELTQAFIPDDPVWDINGTVASLALEAAVKLDAQKIYLVGQDLAYPGGQMYANGLPHEEKISNSHELQTLSVDGSLVATCEAFEWFKLALEYQIAKYSYIEFINLSKHGAMIKGTKVDIGGENV